MSNDSSGPRFPGNVPDKKKSRPSRGNVIYANFRGNQEQDSAKSLLDKLRTERTPTPRDEFHQPIAKFVMDSVQRRADTGRVKRGITYSITDHVLPNIRFDSDVVLAYVSGSQNDPFEVKIVFPRRSPDEIARLTEILAADPLLFDQDVIDGEVLDIVAAKPDEGFSYRCTCPDPAYVCKHIVAVSHQLALILEEDPRKVFDIRGIDIRELEQSVSSSVVKLSERRAVESSEAFWEGGPIPDLPRPRTALAIEDGDDKFLHQAFREISYSTIDEMRAVSDLEDLYYALIEDDY